MARYWAAAEEEHRHFFLRNNRDYYNKVAYYWISGTSEIQPSIILTMIRVYGHIRWLEDCTFSNFSGQEYPQMFREIDLSPSSGETIKVGLTTESVQRYRLSVPYVLNRKVSPFRRYTWKGQMIQPLNYSRPLRLRRSAMSSISVISIP